MRYGLTTHALIASTIATAPAIVTIQSMMVRHGCGTPRRTSGFRPWYSGGGGGGAGLLRPGQRHRLPRRRLAPRVLIPLRRAAPCAPPAAAACVRRAAGSRGRPATVTTAPAPARRGGPGSRGAARAPTATAESRLARQSAPAPTATAASGRRAPQRRLVAAACADARVVVAGRRLVVIAGNARLILVAKPPRVGSTGPLISRLAALLATPAVDAARDRPRAELRALPAAKSGGRV